VRPLIALLTDFGTRDHYVGTMKGVILGICPDAALVDITHEIAPQDVVTGALELAAAHQFFPDRTVFLCVVDPGVGSSRRAIAVSAGRHRFVAPDNGLLSLVADEAATVVELANARYALPVVSRTFEGRDRFAPAAAWLASGVELTQLGPRVDALARVHVPLARVSDRSIDGEVLRVDRFGNLVTNIFAAPLELMAESSGVTVTIAGRTAGGVVAAYAEIPDGELGALIGSTGQLEIAAGGGSAAALLGCGRGSPVHVSRAA
jgi:S-adenosyl-L-methionine hydrolase (adenosine-forming)